MVLMRGHNIVFLISQEKLSLNYLQHPSYLELSIITPSDTSVYPKFLHNNYYTRGQVSVNKRISVLSNYFDVSFEIYYVRLKYIDSIGQVVELLILRPASICCTFNSGHVGSRAPNVNKMGCLFYFHIPGTVKA